MTEVNVEMTSDETLLYSFKEVEGSHTVEALFNTNTLQIETEDKSCLGVSGSTIIIPKRKLTDYWATETSCCGCTESQISFLTTDDDPHFEAGTKKQVSFKVKGKLDYEKLDTYVYGPLAHAGDAIQVFSTLINDGLMAPIELKMDREGMDQARASKPSGPAACVLSMTGETDGIKTTATFRTDAAVLDYETCCCFMVKQKFHVVAPRYQLTNFSATSEAPCCCTGKDTVIIEQQGKTPICGRFLPVYHKMQVPKGSYNKAALISYIYGGSSGAAVSEAQHGASHLINSRLAKPIKVEQDMMKLFAA